MSKLLTVLFMIGTLAACNDTQVPYRDPGLSFAGNPYILNVASINFVEEYRPSAQPPHVETLASITPSEAMRQWTDARLHHGGTTGYAEVVVKNGSIIREDLPKQKKGLEGLLTHEQTERYNGALEAEIKIYDGNHTMPVAKVSASSKSSRTVAENATVNDRNKTYRTISEDLIQLLEKELDRNIQEHFNRYLL